MASALRSSQSRLEGALPVRCWMKRSSSRKVFPSLSDSHETSGTYEISVAKQGEMGPLRQ
jgi:hypothetical protein